MEVLETGIGNILTRTSGFLKTVASHSIQPYRGCTFGHSLCGVGCYVRHNRYVTRGRSWGDFLEVRVNASESYRRHYSRERSWAQRQRNEFRVFFSSSTEPFLPQESRYGVSRGLLETMAALPPDGLIVQTHSHRVADHTDLLSQLNQRLDLRVHISIETDRERIPGLPAPPCSVESRFAAAARLKAAGLFVVICVAPLLPIDDPPAFFQRVAECADAVVIDHFIQGDGTPHGTRTLKTSLPKAMEELSSGSSRLDYRDQVVATAKEYLPSRVGVNIDGFAGRWSGR